MKVAVRPELLSSFRLVRDDLKRSLAARYRGWVLDSWLLADGWIGDGDLGSGSSVDDRLSTICAIGAEYAYEQHYCDHTEFVYKRPASTDL